MEPSPERTRLGASAPSMESFNRSASGLESTPGLERPAEQIRSDAKTPEVEPAPGPEGPRFGDRRMRQLRWAQYYGVPTTFIIPGTPILPTDDETAWAEFELLPEFLARVIDRSLYTTAPAAAVRQTEDAYQEIIRRGEALLRSTFIYALHQALTQEGAALTPAEFTTFQQVIGQLRGEVPANSTELEQNLEREQAGYEQVVTHEQQELVAAELPYVSLDAKALPVARAAVTRADLRALVEWKGRSLGPEMLLDVFAAVRASAAVPRIDVRAGPKMFVKVTDTIVPPTVRETKRQADRRRADYLSFTVVLGDRAYSAIWNSVDSTLVVAEVEWSRLAELTQLLREALPELGLRRIPSTMLSGELEFVVPGGFRPWSWFGLALTNPAYASLYLTETKIPAALNPAWSFIHRNDGLVPLRFRSAGDDLTITYHRVPNYATVQRLVDLLGLLLGYAATEAGGWVAFFDALGLPDEPAASAPAGEARTPAAKPRIMSLKEADPEAFGAGYSGECMGRRQPVLVAPADRAAVEAETFLYENRLHQRQVMDFPLDQPKHLVTCPETDYPFPGLIVNRGENAVEYPYLPCCFSHDEMNNPSSRYNQYLDALEYRSGLQEQKGSRAGGLVRTRKALQPGSHGEIGGSAPALFARLAGLPGITIQRVGLPVDANTLLAGILFAKTGRMPTAEAVARERKQITAEFKSGTVSLAALSQEQSDWDEPERLARLASDTEPLTTDRWIRLADLLYDVNLIVLVITKVKAQKEIQEFERPRSLGPYIRAWNPDQPTVVFVTNPQIVAPVLADGRPVLEGDVPVTTPAYDLLAWSDQVEAAESSTWSGRGARVRANRYIFPPEFSASLQGELAELEPTWMWRPEMATPVRNPFTSDLELNRLFNLVAELGVRGQLIDTFGKCRGLEVGQGLVYLPPSAPLALPAVGVEGSETKARSLAPWIKLFGLPAAVGQAGAYWSTDYFPLGVYVPGRPDAVPETVPLVYVPPPSLRAAQSIPPSRRAQLQRQAHFIQQLLLWLVHLSLRRGEDFDEQKAAVSFSQAYVRPARDDIEDSLTAYDFRRVPRELPEATTVAAALRIAATWRTGFLTAEGIVPYAPVFRTALGREIAETYRRARSHIDELGPVRYIRDYYADVTDFEAQPHTVILSGPGQLAQWIEQLTAQDYTVPYTETPDRTSLTRPYLFQHTTEAGAEMLLLQNVLDGAQARAAAVAQTWLEALPDGTPRQVNLGYRAEPLAELPPLEVYTYDSAIRALVAVRSDVGAAAALLRYPDGTFAAILPLQTAATTPPAEPKQAPLPEPPLA